MGRCHVARVVHLLRSDPGRRRNVRWRSHEEEGCGSLPFDHRGANGRVRGTTVVVVVVMGGEVVKRKKQE